MADKRLDDYKPLKFYEDARPSNAAATGFYKFSDEGLEYFAYQRDGKVMLISQAYKARAGRDNGIVSTKKNMAIEEQYEFHKHANGKHYFDILARNKQQVATSVWFASAKAAKEYSEVLTGKRKAVPAAAKATAATATAASAKGQNVEQNYRRRDFYESRAAGVKNGFATFEDGGQHYFTFNKNGKVVLISEGYPDARTRDRGMASVEKNMPMEERYRYAGSNFSLIAGNNKEIARGIGYGTAAAAATGAAALYAVKKARAANVEQNYKKLAFYQAHVNEGQDGFSTFEEDGQHYFTYNQDGKIALISEGYPTAAIRDKGIASVKNNMREEKQYSYGAVGGGYEGFRLKAKNHKEIARSVGYGTLAAATAGAMAIYAPKPKAAAAIPPAKPVAKPIPVAPTVAPPAAPIAAVGAAALGTAALAGAAMARDPEPEPVAYTEPVAVHTEAGGFGWLKWLLLAAVLAALAFFLLKMCNRPEVVSPKIAPVSLVACWDGSEAENLAACPTSVTCADGSKAANQAACPVVDVTCWDGSTAATLSACPVEPVMMTCWDGSEVADIASCPAEPAAVATPAPAPVTTRATATSAPGSCSCAASNAKIFQTDGFQTPIPVNRLGTNPEFGNAQGISATAFYDRLASRYATSDYDRNYLDYLARSIGYSGFSAMDASMFSETTLDQGVTGILGFGSQHAYQYSRLDVIDSADLAAFKVRSANGCDVNFMKTCGNYMYVCD